MQIELVDSFKMRHFILLYIVETQKFLLEHCKIKADFTLNVLLVRISVLWESFICKMLDHIALLRAIRKKKKKKKTFPDQPTLPREGHLWTSKLFFFLGLILYMSMIWSINEYFHTCISCKMNFWDFDQFDCLANVIKTISSLSVQARVLLISPTSRSILFPTSPTVFCIINSCKVIPRKTRTKPDLIQLPQLHDLILFQQGGWTTFASG